eukprot:m.50189 g.50189  ORF g.50189 m.50189 type:complete len:156 (+) comp12886_c0_seq2:30-497(+)
MAPSYELSLILRKADKKSLVDLLTRLSSTVLQRGGLIRDASDMGNSVLPYRMRAHLEYHDRGRYAFLKMDCSPQTVKELGETIRIDKDVIRHNFVRLPDISVSQKERFHRCKNFKNADLLSFKAGQTADNAAAPSAAATDSAASSSTSAASAVSA